MSSLSLIIIGACIGSVISIFALVAGVVADDIQNRAKHEEEKAEAYKSGVIVGSRWKEAEKQMLADAVAELRGEVEQLERSSR